MEGLFNETEMDTLPTAPETVESVPVEVNETVESLTNVPEMQGESSPVLPDVEIIADDEQLLNNESQEQITLPDAITVPEQENVVPAEESNLLHTLTVQDGDMSVSDSAEGESVADISSSQPVGPETTPSELSLTTIEEKLEDIYLILRERLPETEIEQETEQPSLIKDFRTVESETEGASIDDIIEHLGSIESMESEQLVLLGTIHEAEVTSGNNSDTYNNYLLYILLAFWGSFLIYLLLRKL